MNFVLPINTEGIVRIGEQGKNRYMQIEWMIEWLISNARKTEEKNILVTVFNKIRLLVHVDSF